MKVWREVQHLSHDHFKYSIVNHSHSLMISYASDHVTKNVTVDFERQVELWSQSYGVVRFNVYDGPVKSFTEEILVSRMQRRFFFNLLILTTVPFVSQIESKRAAKRFYSF